eukprot:5034455-Prymnesium_polylepis.1
MWFIVLAGHPDDALARMGCDIPRTLSWVLAVGLLIHALLFALAAATYGINRLGLGYFGWVPRSKSSRAAPVLLYCSLSIFCIVSFALLLAMLVHHTYAGGEASGRGDSGNPSGGAPRGGGSQSSAASDPVWRARWLGWCLLLLWLQWTIRLAQAASTYACSKRWPFYGLELAPPQTSMTRLLGQLFTLASMLVFLAAWA